MEGSVACSVQIDESYFSGRRKYGRGRLLGVNMGIETASTSATARTVDNVEVDEE